jgi:hypothetical protein
MKNIVKTLSILMLFMGLSVKPAMAAARLTLDPSAKTLQVGETMVVTVNAYSEIKTVAGIDAKISFDLAKIEVVGTPTVKDGTGFVLKHSISGGTLSIALYKNDAGDLGTVAINGAVASVVFRAKEAGTANAKYICTASSMTDSNILNYEGGVVVDLISCADNTGGVYTITSSGAATSTPGPTNTPAPGSTSTPTPGVSTPVQSTSAAQLPRTGSTGTTVVLTLFGLLGVAGAFILRAL